MSANEKPEYKCLQCGWVGAYSDIRYENTCNEPGCCTEPVCPECGSSWPVPFDDIIDKEFT